MKRKEFEMIGRLCSLRRGFGEWIDRLLEDAELYEMHPILEEARDCIDAALDLLPDEDEDEDDEE